MNDTIEDKTTSVEIKAPITPGFYYNDGAAQTMIYLLDHQGQWWAIIDNGMMEKCVWAYIEQTVTAYPLKMVGT
jgi:hypothetical protein